MNDLWPERMNSNQWTELNWTELNWIEFRCRPIQFLFRKADRLVRVGRQRHPRRRLRRRRQDAVHQRLQLRRPIGCRFLRRIGRQDRSQRVRHSGWGWIVSTRFWKRPGSSILNPWKCSVEFLMQQDGRPVKDLQKSRLNLNLTGRQDAQGNPMGGPLEQQVYGTSIHPFIHPSIHLSIYPFFKRNVVHFHCASSSFIRELIVAIQPNQSLLFNFLKKIKRNVQFDWVSSIRYIC